MRLNGWSPEQKRRQLRRYVGSITIAKSTRGRWQPIEERCTVTWVDGSEPVLADDVAAA